MSYLDPSLELGIELLDLVFLDGHSAVVSRSLPVELAAVGSDVRDGQRSLGPGRPAEDYKLDPLLVEAVDVLNVDEVLGGILVGASQGCNSHNFDFCALQLPIKSQFVL